MKSRVPDVHHLMLIHNFMRLEGTFFTQAQMVTGNAFAAKQVKLLFTGNLEKMGT